MASTIIIKNGTGSAVPSSLTQGELAINVDNGALFYGTSGSSNAVSSSFIFTELSASNIVTHLNITASGNISASGTITALSMSGDGSELTNVSATLPSGVISSSLQDLGNITGSNITLDGNSFTMTNANTPTIRLKDTTNNFFVDLKQANNFGIELDGNSVQDFYIATNEYNGTTPTTTALYMDGGDGRLSLNDQKVSIDVLGNISASGTVSASILHAASGQLIGDTEEATSLLVTGEISGSQISSSGNISATGTITGNSIVGTVGTATQGTIDHDSLANFVANEHIDHTSVTLTAGSGLSGGGDISANRSLAVATTQTHITSITNTGLKVGRATDDTYIDFGTDDKIKLKPANATALEVETTGIDVTGEITASGNISASLNSKIFASSASFGGASFLRSFNVKGAGLEGRLSLQGAAGTDNPGIEFTVNDNTSRALIRLDQVGTNGTALEFFTEPDGGDIANTLTIGHTGHITASGNISSSGTGENYFGGDINLMGADLIIENNQKIQFENTGGSEFGNIFMNTNNNMLYQNLKSNGDINLKAGNGGNEGNVIIMPGGSTDVIAQFGETQDLYVKGHVTASSHIYALGALGVGTTTPTTTGLIRATNDVVAFYSSDERLKENILELSGSVDKISQIRGVEFDWVPKEGVHENEGHDIGVIAQEIEKVFPEVVQTRENGYKAVKYDKLTAVLISAIKELKAEIDELKKK